MTQTTHARPSSPSLPPTDGAAVCAWIEANLVHAEGDHFGRPFTLHPFQRRFLYHLYERTPSGRRLRRRALLGLPKGNGKTELAAAIAVVELGGPVAPPSPVIPVAAASFEQADLVFGAARTMIAEGPLRPFFELFDTEILRKDGPGRMYRVAAAAGTNDGARPTCLIADELHEWTGSRERVHLVLSNGLSKRQDGLELNITTAGSEEDSLLGRLVAYGRTVASGERVDPSFLFEWHEASTSWDLDTEDGLRHAIEEANPALGLFIDEERLVARAAEIPEHEFRRYHLNQWVASADAWLTPAQWAELAVPDGTPADGTSVVLGFDGSYSRDSTALVGCTLDGHLFVVAAWEKDTRDPDWTVPRIEVDAAVAEAMRRFDVVELAADPPGWHHELEGWQRESDAVVAFETNQPARMAPACDRFYSAVVEGKLSHDGDPRLARHVANAHTRDTRYGRIITKRHRSAPEKIDLAVAAVIAYERATQREEPPAVLEPLIAWA